MVKEKLFYPLILLVFISSGCSLKSNAVSESPASANSADAKTPPRHIRVDSPVVHPDRKVTFRLHAPKARTVTLGCRFAPGLKPMKKDPNGIWSLTLGPAEPGLYEYYFVADGFQTIDPANPDVKLGLRPRVSLVEVSDDPPAFFQVQNVPHGILHTHTYYSQSLQNTRRMVVYTPPDYKEYADRKFPVLYLLHGAGDDERGWIVIGRANIIMDNLLAQKKAVPMLVVMPFGHTPDQSSGASDAFEKDLLGDIIPCVEKNYRVRSDSAHRALAGLSMGGGQTVKIGFRHPELFDYLGPFSAAVRQKYLGDSLEKLEANSQAFNKHFELIYIAIGKSDFLYSANRDFMKLLDEKGIDYTANITQGGHEWRLWRQYLNELAPLLFKKNSSLQKL